MDIIRVSFCFLQINNTLKVILLVLIIIICGSISASSQKLLQASGVIYQNDTLYIVGNDKRSDKAIFKHKLDYNSLIEGKFPKPKDFTPECINSDEATDLEGIAFFNGKPVVLSEDNAKIFTTHNTIVDYYYYDQDSAKETSNHRGLEGLAIKQINHSTSLVAALWEGGFVDDRRRPPFIMVHKLKHGLTEVFDASVKLTKDDVFKLDQDLLYDKLKLTDKIGSTKLALSASELLWYGSGFIVLIVVRHDDHFEKKWLCKIDKTNTGYKTTSFVSLDKLIENDVDKNWEGMTWIDEDHRKILLAADDGGRLPMKVIEIPEDW